MARTKSAEATGKVAARLLVDCQYGRINQVVELEQAEIDAAVAVGLADPHPEAVAYAMSLPENRRLAEDDGQE